MGSRCELQSWQSPLERGSPWWRVKGTPLHPFQWFCEIALSFLWLIPFFLFYFEGYFLLVLKSKFFCPCWHEIRGILVLNEKGSVDFWEQSGMILYLVGWSSTKSLLWKAVFWFCSEAAEQTILWFSTPRPLSLGATGIPSTLVGSLQFPSGAEPTAGRVNANNSCMSCSCLLPAESLQVKQMEKHLTAPDAVILRQMSLAFWSNHPQSCDQPTHPFSTQAHPNTAPSGGWCCCWGWLVCFALLCFSFWGFLVCQFTPAENQICMSSVLFI